MVVALAAAPLQSRASFQVDGEVQFGMQIDVKPEAGGKIKKLHVKAGDNVRTGDVLAEIVEEGDQAIKKVRAPRGCTVASIVVIEGQWVRPTDAVDNGATLMTLADGLIVIAELGKNQAGKVALRQSVQVSAESIPTENISATVSFIAPIETSRNGVKTHEIRLVIDKPAAGLRPGMPVQLKFPEN
jgi:multidrug efflux pump subunit AcrA (membrane-fusion protein)